MSVWPRVMCSLLAAMGARARDRVRHFGISILLAALAALIATMGLAMLVGSAFLCLADSMTAPAAAAVTGGGLLVAAGCVAATARLLSHSRSHRSTGGAAAREDGIANVLASVETAISRTAQAEAPGLALIALLAGCAIGASPSLRRAIAELALAGRRAE